MQWKWTTWSTVKIHLLLLLSVLRPLDQHFLVFFFSRLKANHSGRYQQDFPFLSLCGRERNFLRCDDQPVVFTHLLSEGGQEKSLSYCGGGAKLTVPFRPESLFMHPVSGRVYHPGPERGGGVGLVRSALAIELSAQFEYAPGQESTGQPTHFLWGGHRHALTKELAKHFPVQKDACAQWILQIILIYTCRQHCQYYTVDCICGKIKIVNVQLKRMCI